MSSGEKNLVFNTRERAISTDYNRLQSFIARDRSQLARRQHNDFRQNTYQYPGVSSENVGTEVPLSADVYGGLMVDPLTSSVLVTPGEIGCLFPDPAATADDSPYMLIDDPGVQTAGVLTFTANASGLIRIDLVECRPVATALESDSRDIFAPGTGLFTPQNVPKVQGFRLQYRIRTGTGGAGVPAREAGWLPLAVIIVPSSAADFSTCDFYDVRPLVEERVRPQPAYVGGTFNTEQYCPVRDNEYYTIVSGSDTLLQGYAETTFGGYLAGGWLRRSSPYVAGGSFAGSGPTDGDPDFINCSISENKATSAFAPAASSLVYVGAFFPAGLPRWVRYSHSAIGSGVGRAPKGPRGIIMMTTQAPYRNGVILPTLIGHGFVSAAPGVVLAALAYNSGGTTYVGGIAQGGAHRSAVASLGLSATASSTTVVEFLLVANGSHPGNASELEAQLLLQYNNSGAVDVASLKIEIYFAGAPTIAALVTPAESVAIPAGSAKYVAVNVRIPIIARETPTTPSGGAQTTVKVTLSAAVAIEFAAGSNVQKFNTLGWRLGS